jgi:serine/threonine protein kinase
METKEIGRGGYGVVFCPPLGMGVDTYDKVGKVMYQDLSRNSQKDIEIEWSHKKLLQPLDPNQNHFLYPLTLGEVAVDEYNKHSTKPLLQDDARFVKLFQLTMLHGGLSLRKRVEKGNMFGMPDALRCIRHAALSAQVLLRNNLIHQDIHLDNIVVSDAGKCRLIDFGLMMNAKKLYTTSNHLWSLDYAVNPPEFRLSQAVKKKNHTLKFEQELLALYLRVNSEKIAFVYKDDAFQQSFNTLHSAMRTLSQPRINTKKDRLNYFKNAKSHEKSDVYSLGVCLLELSTLITLPHNVLDIIIQALMPNPEDRLSMDAFIEKVEHVLVAI